VATKAQIQVSVTGFKQLQNLQASVKAVVPQIDKANAAFIRLTGASKQTLPIIANLRTELEKSKKAFQGSVLGTQAATTAAKTLANAERLVNNELSRRNALLNKARGLRVSAVDKSIARNQRRRPKRDPSSGFASFSRDADEIGLQGQSSPVGGRIQRIIAIKQDEIRLQQALLSLEQKSAAVLNEKLQIQGEVNRQTALEVEKKLLRGQSSPLTSDIRGNIGDIKSRREANILSERKNQFSNVNPGAGGFRSFSRRASEIQKATKAEIALAKSRRVSIEKTNSLISIERKRAQTQSFAANLRRFRRGRTSADRAVRGRVGSSALVGGGFPLLFGGGPVSALAGGLGGGIGELFGKGGGFAGSIAATAIAQTIQQAVTAISELGQALGPFTQNTQAATAAMGLQGSAQEAQLKRIERTQGKTAAFNVAMKMMENRIGTSGVRKIKEFGETTRVLGTIFSTALLRLQAFAAGVVNFVARLLAGEKQLKDAEVNQTIKDAAASGNVEAQALLDREREIEETGFRKVGHGGSRKIMKSGTKEKLEELDRDKQLFAVRQKVSLANDEILSKSQDLVATKTDELDLQNRIKEEMAKGTNKELATSLARVNQVFDKEQEILQSKFDQSKLDQENAIKDGITGDKLQEIKDIHQANTEELEKHNKLRGDAIKLTKDLNLATDSLKTNFERIGESIASGVSDNLTAAIQGTKTLGDAAKSILNDLSSSLIRLGVNTLLSKIPGFGGLPILGGKARGGPVKAGGSFVVGEKGPELFVPKRSGTIIPNDKLGGGSTNISVNVDASGSSVQGNNESGKELGRAISAAIQSELLKQKRPGGLLR